MREFNVTGVCVADKHYMVDTSDKLAKIKALIDKGAYFTINRARQYGKTTTLSLLRKQLQNEYTVISISFEGLGDESFAGEEMFCSTFLECVQDALQFAHVTPEYINQWHDENVTGFKRLSKHITKMCKDQKIVLMIDEVDKTSNHQVFLNFLSMLRDKYNKREDGLDHTFHSVILAGVHDIKNIKAKLVREGKYTQSAGEGSYNSPWNIAADFTVDMSFSPPEIATMLKEYEADHSTGMDISALSQEIYTYTSGYPFLVSRICKHIDENLDKDWTIKGVQEAVKIIQKEDNTLFDDLFKNLENNKNLYELIYDVLIVGKQRTFDTGNPTVKLGAIYGIIKDSEQGAAISNRIFELKICNYFISKDEENQTKQITGVLASDVIKDGKFDMELCLRKFAAHYAEIFNPNNEQDVEFLERHGRLLFLSYLRPLINGQGFYHIESQFTDLRRMDIVVDFGKDQFIIELKRWKGETALEKAYDQLFRYMDSKNAKTGYLLTFDFRKKWNKNQKAEWVEREGKRIFDVVV